MIHSVAAEIEEATLGINAVKEDDGIETIDAAENPPRFFIDASPPSSLSAPRELFVANPDHYLPSLNSSDIYDTDARHLTHFQSDGARVSQVASWTSRLSNQPYLVDDPNAQPATPPSERLSAPSTSTLATEFSRRARSDISRRPQSRLHVRTDHKHAYRHSFVQPHLSLVPTEEVPILEQPSAAMHGPFGRPHIALVPLHEVPILDPSTHSPARYQRSLGSATGDPYHSTGTNGVNAGGYPVRFDGEWRELVAPEPAKVVKVRKEEKKQDEEDGQSGRGVWGNVFRCCFGCRATNDS